MVCSDDFFYDGKSQTGSFSVFSAGGIQFVESFPDFIQAGTGNSLSGVFDRYKDCAVFFCSFYFNSGIVVTEFDGSVHKINRLYLFVPSEKVSSGHDFHITVESVYGDEITEGEDNNDQSAAGSESDN